MIDLECQLAGKLVDTKVMGALEHKGLMPPQHLMVIDTTLSMPGATLEAEYQRWINAINAMTAFCPVEEGRPTPQPKIRGFAGEVDKASVRAALSDLRDCGNEMHCAMSLSGI